MTKIFRYCLSCIKQQGRFLHKLLAFPGVCNLCLHCLDDAVIVKFTVQSLLYTQRFLEDSEHGQVWMPQQTQAVTAPCRACYRHYVPLSYQCPITSTQCSPAWNHLSPPIPKLYHGLFFMVHLALLLKGISVFVNRSLLLPYRIQKRSRKNCCYLSWELGKIQVDINWSVSPIFSG